MLVNGVAFTDNLFLPLPLPVQFRMNWSSGTLDGLALYLFSTRIILPVSTPIIVVTVI